MYYSSTICFLYINYTINRQSIFTGGKHKINRQRNIHKLVILSHRSILTLIRLIYLRISGASLVGNTCAKE